MRSSLVVSRNSTWFDPSILRDNGIRGAADEALLNTVHRRKKIQKNPLVKKNGGKYLET
jgi:hypothetical protein